MGYRLCKNIVKFKILRFLSVFITVILFLAVAFVAAPSISLAASTYTVTNTNDSGPGSLRKAIEEANADTVRDNIHFKLRGSHTIQPHSPLDTITDPVVIDGETDSHFAGKPIVEISGRLAGSSNGLYIIAGNSTVRGLVINRFKKSGIRLEGQGGNTIRANYLGTNAAGTTGLGNGAYGLDVSSSSNNVIGQASGSGRNLISGNAADGIHLINSTFNLIQGNYIGTDVSGAVDLGNAWSGMTMSINSNRNTIGGTARSARNIISGNNHAGVSIHYGSSDNVIHGNYIGIGAGGNALGNTDDGVSVKTFAGGGNAVGGKTAGSGNTIACNVRSGVSIDTGSRDSVLGNSIYENGRLGIDLYGDGVTPNDDKDPDGGPNRLQNYPLITKVTPTDVEGMLFSKPNTTFRIELFSNRIPDPSGYGEGQTYLGFVNVTTGDSGVANFSAPITGTYVTATATDPSGNTSEFGTRKNIGSTSWVVPEGSTGGGFDTWVLIQNPNEEEVQVEVTFTTEEGPRNPVVFKMAPESRTTLRAADIVPDNFNVSTMVKAGSPVVVERSMYWDKDLMGETDIPADPQPYEMRSGHADLGVPWEAVYRPPGSQGEPRTIYFPEGSTAPGFDTWILLTNPEGADASADITLMTPRGVALEKEVTVPALSRKTLHLDELLPGVQEVATEVTSSTTLMAERSTYWDPNEAALAPYQMRGGHSTGGSTETATEWYLAEGATGGGFETFVSLLNPQAESAKVTTTFMNASGMAGKAVLTMPPRSRKTIRISDYVPNDFQVSTKVISDEPVVAERSTYWDKRKASEPCAMRDGHATMGFIFTGATWVVPEGSTGGGFDSWVLIYNPNETSVGVTVTFMTQEGPGTPFDIIVKANSRYTLHVNDHVQDNFNVSTRITSKGGLVVERAMYWDRREAEGIQPYEMMGGHSAQGFTP